MKIVSVDEDKLAGVIKFTDFELTVYKNALRNFERSVCQQDYELILGANDAQIDQLLKKLRNCCSEIRSPYEEERQSLACKSMHIVSIDSYHKTISLKLTKQEANAFNQSLIHLSFEMDDIDCDIMTGFWLFEIQEITANLISLCREIPWKSKYNFPLAHHRGPRVAELRFAHDRTVQQNKIISIDEEKFTGIFAVSKFELMIFDKAFDNFDEHIPAEDYKKIFNANPNAVKKLENEIDNFVFFTDFSDERELKNQAGQMMEIVSLDHASKLIHLKLSSIEARALYCSLAWLNVTMEDIGCTTAGGLEPYMLKQVAEKVKKIYAEIPWELEFPPIEISEETSNKKIRTISIDQDMFTGVFEISKFELMAIDKACDNFDQRIVDEEVQQALGVSSLEIEELMQEIYEFKARLLFSEDKVVQSRAGQFMEIVSFDFVNKTIFLKMSSLEASTLDSVFRCLDDTLESGIYSEFSGLEPFMLRQVATKLKQICASVPW